MWRLGMRSLGCSSPSPQRGAASPARDRCVALWRRARHVMRRHDEPLIGSRQTCGTAGGIVCAGRIRPVLKPRPPPRRKVPSPLPNLTPIAIELIHEEIAACGKGYRSWSCSRLRDTNTYRYRGRGRPRADARGGSAGMSTAARKAALMGPTLRIERRCGTRGSSTARYTIRSSRYASR